MAIANAQIPAELSIFLKTKISVKDKSEHVRLRSSFGG